MSDAPRAKVSDVQTYRRLLRYAHGLYWVFGAGCAGFILQSGATAASAEIIDFIIDSLQSKDASQVRVIALLMVGLVLLRSVGGVVGDLALAHVSFAVVHRLRVELFERLLNLPTAFFDRNTLGHLVSRLTFTVTQVREATADAVKTCLEQGSLVIGLMGYLFYKNWQLTIVFLALAPLIGAVVAYAGRRFRRISQRIQSTMGDVTQVATETVQGHRVVRVFGGERYEQTRFHDVSNDNRRQNLKLAVTKAVSAQIVQVFLAMALALLVVLIFAFFIDGMDAGDVVAFMVAAGMMAKPIEKLSEVNAVLQRGLAAADDVFAQMDVPGERDHGTLTSGRARGAVEFRNVSFEYERSDTAVLNDLSFAVAPGTRVAIVGRSGSGKSTLASLLARFYLPSSGLILLDGQPIESYRLADLRRQIAVVSQHVTLFNDTIARNIAYGELGDRSHEEICEAARRGHALEFIEQLPDGLDTQVGDNGLLLSGGQRQRLAIARAILKDAPLLILDEATSALDNESERLIQSALDEVMMGRTTFVIAHRLSTIENADVILVLEDGRIVEQGTHGELLAKNAAYAQLHVSQFSSEPAGTGVVALPVPQEPTSDGWKASLLAHWYNPTSASVLTPLAKVYGWLSDRRRQRYLSGRSASVNVGVPVIVVGNITVGGTGKTPFVIWLAEWLKRRGHRPGIISRGYKGKSDRYPLFVEPSTDPATAGDEAPMLAGRTGCPVVVDPDRVRAAQVLLENCGCDVIVCDDGLQHYRLQRQFEIALVDGARGLGNGQCLPAGPLREPAERLDTVNLVIANGQLSHLRDDELLLRLEPVGLFRVDDGSAATIDTLFGKQVHGVAAIGNPARFFQTLRDLGALVEEHPFADHHAFVPGDLAFTPAQDGTPALLVMTEKDAVKCHAFAHQQPWYFVRVAVRFSEQDELAIERALQPILGVAQP